ncbi:Kinesin-like protein kif1b [Schistosoma haematobium]|uniref:Kinesin-like protein kif1b n=1 Tax=Schistosoma haematobium TaxID=6185 RepID=A0A922LRF3_SCHHA|nr:Kinesin-like protein kif1b [Schistosoma haematobium]XP_051072050.1 Kinesin-like protein kif1b [Schistosoma haematobium]KAH9591942.1 Kinesin-like protein kif1b [Schistosoma haematobium]KAH9591946.1 Kinesin-like protein kif1b [Schistosoma haematobium]
MFHTTNCGLFTDDSLEITTDFITCYLKFCFDICCPTETIFVSFDRLTPSKLKRLRRVRERLYKEKNCNEVRELNGLINVEIRRLNCIFTEKLLSCKNSPSMWKVFKELTDDRQIRSDNQLNVCDLNKSFVRQSSDVMLPSSTGLKNSRVPRSTETDVRRCLQLLNLS